MLYTRRVEMHVNLVKFSMFLRDFNQNWNANTKAHKNPSSCPRLVFIRTDVKTDGQSCFNGRFAEFQTCLSQILRVCLRF
jgi:hypothetical protein